MRSLKYKLLVATGFFILLFSAQGIPAVSAAATRDTCGKKSLEVSTAIDIGCKGRGNPIADASFAIIRFLSYGVGLVVVGSIIVGGIQYSSSRGDPQATARAIERIRSTLIALIIFIFAFPILNYLIPAGFLK